MIELNKTNFETEVKIDQVVFVDFWSDGCATCKDIMPGVHELAEKYGDKIKFCSLNIKGARRLAIKQKVMGLPAMLMYRNGEEFARISPDEIDEKIENVENFILKVYNEL